MASAPRHAASRSSRTWLQRLAISAGALLTVACLAAATGIGYLFWITGQFSRANLALDSAGSKEPRNYLVIGSDSRANVDPNDPDAGAILGPGLPDGKRSDTILIVRIDPVQGTVKMLSFPRDLWVPMADTGQNDRINAAYGRGRQVLVDTIRRDFGVEINNYIEVDFEGFKGLVSALGGVPMYFDTPMRDTHTGLDIPQAGCVNLSPEQALAFARSRYLEFQDTRGRWQSDGTADLGRITRQQIFVRKALHKALSLGITDLGTFTRLLNVAKDSVTIDQTLDRGDLFSLVQRFKALQPSDIESYSVPVRNYVTNGGADVLLLDQNAAQSTLDIFRGVDPGQLQAGQVTVKVLNGSGTAGQARDVRTALGAVGFALGSASNAPVAGQTTIRYAPGSEAAADLLARHLTSPSALTADPTLDANHLVLVTGADFTTVMQTPRPAQTTTTTAPSDGSAPADTATTPSAPTTSTTVVGITPGEAPPGVQC
ncbi:MAG TPA: LCP family protein [Acidimicrobiales bacterium]|jgi:LCP family protein required for cell wall assembly|nr:LCP family protein [Acidimicrobiales bacterium]